MPEHRSKLNTCAWWLERGFQLLLAQPGKKHLVSGWGEHKAKIKTIEEAKLYTRLARESNLAVLGGKEKIILDFDDRDLYSRWADRHAQLARTYTEQSPRGVHVFFDGAAPAGLVLVPGVEIKKICLVAPSVVDGKPYTRGEGEILHADPSEIFSSLSKPGTRTAYCLQADAARRRHYKPGGGMPGLIGQIKAYWTIERVFQTYRPAAQLRGDGRYKQTQCPFHDDIHPSFFLDTEKQLFGCHGCQVHGDVINLYARFEGIENREAISRMAKSLQAVQK